MLRSGELEGERREERIKGVLGALEDPGGCGASVPERRDAGGATADILSGASEPPSGEATASTPSEASELLLKELGRLESRLEATEIQDATLRQSLERDSERADREREKADELRAELDEERARRREEPRGAWRRLFGG